MVFLLQRNLGDQLSSTLMPNPNMPVEAVQEHLSSKFEIKLSAHKAYRAKQLALAKIRGSYVGQYRKLLDYILELQRSNEDTTVKLDVFGGDPNSNTRRFKRIYICFGALKKGFKACEREFLGLDAAFMKAPFPGQVLTAVGVNPNNGIYPLAFAIVEAETSESWRWFLQCLGDDLDLNANSNFTFISDRQKGIILAVATLFRNAEHRFCLRHIHQNMKKQWPGKGYMDNLWRCVSATSVPVFSSCMAQLKEFNEVAYEWLSDINPQHWTRSHFTS